MDNNEKTLVNGLNDSAKIIFQNNKEKGFWDNTINIGERLMLIVSELGEAMEAHRKGLFADFELFEKEMQANNRFDYAFEYSFKLHIKDTFEDEIADTLIRILDLAGGTGIDLEKHINAKVRYNKTRPRLHGKKY